MELSSLMTFPFDVFSEQHLRVIKYYNELKGAEAKRC